MYEDIFAQIRNEAEKRNLKSGVKIYDTQRKSNEGIL